MIPQILATTTQTMTTATEQLMTTTRITITKSSNLEPTQVVRQPSTCSATLAKALMKMPLLLAFLIFKWVQTLKMLKRDAATHQLTQLVPSTKTLALTWERTIKVSYPANLIYEANQILRM
jgi:hypothetical protein